MQDGSLERKGSENRNAIWKTPNWCKILEASKAVVLKLVSLGSLKKEILIPWRKFVLGRNWGGKAVDEETSIFIICLFNT